MTTPLRTAALLTMSDPAAKAKGKAKAKGQAKVKAAAKATSDSGRERADLPHTGESLAKQLAKDDEEEDEENESDIELDENGNSKYKKWVKIFGRDTGQENKFLLNLQIDTMELRRTLSKYTGVNTRELVFEIDGHEWVEARELPLKNFDPENQVVMWYVGNRLRRLMKRRHLATINNLDKFERSLIHFAIIDGDFEILREVVADKDFNFRLINKQDVFGDTPLHHASILGYADIVELMLDKQADPNVQNIYQRTPTMLAAEHGHSHAMKALLRGDASLKPNPGNCWKYPNASYFAKHNGRNRVMREIEYAQFEAKVMAEMDDLEDLDRLAETPQKKKGKPKAKGNQAVI